MKTTHKLYENDDEGIPKTIKDQNGEVCLRMCKICGAAESDLDNYPTCTSYTYQTMSTEQRKIRTRQFVRMG